MTIQDCNGNTPVHYAAENGNLFFQKMEEKDENSIKIQLFLLNIMNKSQKCVENNEFAPM